MYCLLLFPVPHANIYVLINPIRLTLDYLTVLWTNFFLLNLSQSVVCVTAIGYITHNLSYRSKYIILWIVFFKLRVDLRMHSI